MPLLAPLQCFLLLLCSACAGAEASETGCDPMLGTCTVDAAAAATAPTMLQISRQAQEQLGHSKRALCFDDDANLVHAAARENISVTSCVDVAEHCNHSEWGHGIMFFCPETCGMCNGCVDDHDKVIHAGQEQGITLTGCADVVEYCDFLGQWCPETCGACLCRDDEANLIFVAQHELGMTLDGCADVAEHCDDPEWGWGVAHFCPATCGLCTDDRGPGSKPGPRPKPGPGECEDRDDELVEVLGNVAQHMGYTLTGCSDVSEHCEDPELGEAFAAFCPVTCGSCSGGSGEGGHNHGHGGHNHGHGGHNHSHGGGNHSHGPGHDCVDMDAELVHELGDVAMEMGFTLTGCVDAEQPCEDSELGDAFMYFCPATCGLCTVGSGPGGKPGPKP